MSANSSNRILSIYKSRKNILELLDDQEYDVNEHNGFSINEVDAMVVKSQLDILIRHKTNEQKVYRIGCCCWLVEGSGANTMSVWPFFFPLLSFQMCSTTLRLFM